MKTVLKVHRSNKYISAQLIDASGKTLGSVKAKDPKQVGKTIAQLATKSKAEAIVFDRGGHKYHGQVKLLADSAREAGLKF